MDVEDNNGPCVDEQHHLSDKLLVEVKSEGFEDLEYENSPRLGGSLGSLSPRTKGIGLKKWRRISRDLNQDGGSNVDNTKMLKRGLSNSRKPTVGSISLRPTAKSSTAMMKGDLGNSGRGEVETSKKFRGEEVKIEKENSHSSLESDSRSSNFVFLMQGTNSAASNGRQMEVGKSSNCDEVDSSQTGFRKDGLKEDLAAGLSGNVAEEKSVKNGSSADRDPLAEIIVKLEEEIQKFREIQTEDTSIFDASDCTSVDTKTHEQSASESQIVNLKQNVNVLEIKLEDAKDMLKMKEVQLKELESTLNSSMSPQALHQQKFNEMEIELEGLFMQKLEAEIEYLAVSKTIPQLRFAAVDPTTLLEERKTLASEQTHMLKKLESAENKATILKRHVEELETCCEEIEEREEVLKLQKRVCKFTSCFFIQLILLVVVLGLFVLQFSPREAGDVVPT